MSGNISPPPHWLIWVITVVCCLLGIPGNIVVIVKLVHQWHHSNMTKHLFLNLAVCDLLTLLGTIGTSTFIGRHLHTFHEVKIYFFFNFFYITKNNILLLMSIQRYYQVVHPQKWSRLGQGGERGLLVGMWLVEAALTLLKVLVYIAGSPQVFVILEVVNLLFIVFSYPVLVTFCLRLHRGVDQTASLNDFRTTKLVILIVTIFLVCSITPLVIRMLLVYAVLKEEYPLFPVELWFGFCFYLINSGLDPFLYFFASRSRRRGRGDAERPTELTPRDPLHDNI